MAKWIKNAIKHPGELHRKLGVPEGEKIPANKLAEAERSKSPEIRREAALARTLSGFAYKKHEAPSGSNVIKSLYGSKG